AVGIIAFNGVRVLRPAVQDLMDRRPERLIVEQITGVARGVEGVAEVEKLRVRTIGTEYYVDLHVQADPMLTLRDAHILSGKVKAAIRQAIPDVGGVLIHMEPYEADESAGG